MKRDLSKHPCFNEKAKHQFSRIHLPVAPNCNIQCRFCNRKYDCINESRPGVTSAVLSPGQALNYLREMKVKVPQLAVVGIAGPGDPFAEPELTMDTLRRVNKEFPEMLLCVATNGFNILPYINELSNFNVSHVTITVNAVDPEIGSRIYAWVRDGKCVRKGKEAASQLLERQLLAIGLLKEKGITVKINTIIIPGVNDTHITQIAKAVAAAGADIMNCIPLLPAADTDFADKPAPTAESVAEIQKNAQQYMPLMKHCTRCRADAVGLLGAPQNEAFISCLRKNSLMSLDPSQDRPYVAVASREGVLINQHLGEADALSIYKENNGKFELIATRKTPAPGGGDKRWLDLAKTLKDCRVILASGAGPSPTQLLQKQGIKVLLMEAVIDEGLKAVFHGGDLAKLQVPWKGCGSSCMGTGNGCS